MKVLREKDREWDYIKEPQITTLLTGKLAGRPLLMKGTDPHAEFNPGNPTDDGIVFYYPEQVELTDKVTLFISLNRQLEMDFSVAGFPEAGAVLLKPTAGRLAKMARAYPRIQNKGKLANGAHFQVSKNEIIIDNRRPQVANKVIYAEFERQLMHDYPGLKIFDFADKERPQVTTYLNKSIKTLLVTDTSADQSFDAPSPEFEDFGAMLRDGGEFESTKRRLQEEQIRSLMVMPIVIETPLKAIPIAFMHMAARGDRSLSLDDFSKWQGIVADIVKRIGEANTLVVDERQKVVNVSEGGVALKITHPDLMKYIPNQKWMTFDLIFRMQAPMRFSGQVVHIEQYIDHLLVGVDLEGSAHSESKTDAKQRLKSLIGMAMAESE